MGLARCISFCGFALAVMHSPEPAGAEPAAVARAGSRRAVSVSIQGEGQDSKVLSATLLEALARLELSMVEPGTRRANELLATVEIQLAPAGARIMVRSSSGGAVLERTVVDPNTEIQREQIADAVRGAVESELLAEGDLETEQKVRAASADPLEPSLKREPTPKQTEPSSGAPKTVQPFQASAERREPKSSAFGLDASLLFGGGPVASQAGSAMRVGAGVALGYRRGSLRPGLAVSGLYAFPFEAGNDELSARASLMSARAVGTLEGFRSSSLALELGIGGGLDVLSVKPVSVSLPAAVLGQPTTRVGPVVSALSTLRISLAPNVVLSLSGIFDVSLVTEQYLFDDRGERSNVLPLWRVRPMLLAGISFTALGASAFQGEPP